MNQVRGPFKASDLRPGDRYELHNGHPIYCPPAGGPQAQAAVVGADTLASDPVVNESGIDAGFTPDPGTLRVPDVAIGNVPGDKPGWIAGAPTLAVEYASTGQDEASLQTKIADLLAAGTKVLWVVRLLGPRRVEEHLPGKPVRVLYPGDTLSAPGILKNTYPIEALYDRETGHRYTLRNLLQRQGYEDLEAVLAEGREQGLEQGRCESAAAAVLTFLEARGLSVADDERRRILACRDVGQLEQWQRRAVTVNQTSELFD